MSRDTQMRKVYAWERLALPGFATNHPLNVSETCELIRQVHTDVRAAGGHAPTSAIIKMTRRKGGACASWFSLNFTPDRVSLFIALHEIAHSLTWCPPVQGTAELKAKWPLGREPLTPFEQHLIDFGDNQGHGPRYVACYIALLERYADMNVADLLETTCSFKMETWGPWERRRDPWADRPTVGNWVRAQPVYRTRTRVVKPASVKVDRKALAYWRGLLQAKERRLGDAA